MKKLLYLAIILLGIGVLSSCSKLGSGSIIGSWKVATDLSSFVSLGDVWTFEEDGFFYINKSVIKVDGKDLVVCKDGSTYSYDSGTGILKINGFPEFRVSFFQNGIPEMSIFGTEDGGRCYGVFQKVEQ